MVYNIIMNFYEVSPIGVIGKDIVVLTYSSNTELSQGHIIEIPVGSRKFVGVVLRKVTRPDFDVKEILRVLFDQPLPVGTMKLHAWLSKFYTTHPSTVWQTMLPGGLNKKRRDSVGKNTVLEDNRSISRTNIVFNGEQLAAIDQLFKMKPGTAILHGITGSGKTEVYKSLVRDVLNNSKSAIILVPEISLTVQLVDEFRRDFSNVIVTHSTITEAERARIWQQCLEADEPLIVIGPRSALFMPLQNLGLIVIDECHEPTYKQEKSPRYNALRAASILVNATGSKLILGSATPLIVDYYTAKKLDRPIVEMKKLARPNAVGPTTLTIDLTKRENFTSESKIFSRQLLKEMKETIAAKKQILLFHNRRGSASTTLCEECGWTAVCPRCFLPLTLHTDKYKLLCHICDHSEKPPTSCPDCGATEILHKGIGTKRIEEEVRKIFPNANVKRFDGDTARGENVADVFDDIRCGDIDIIIGTQQIAKGLDLPSLRLVGIVQADAGLSLPDFSSSERTFQLIAQTVGRVGRGADESHVIIQTYQPHHPSVIHGSTQNYAEFYNYEIELRKRGHFPPFTHLLKLTCVYKTEKGAIQAAQKLAREINDEFADQNIKILGPTPAFYERIRDTYRWQIVVRAQNRQILQEITKIVPPAKWQTELDPNSLI